MRRTTEEQVATKIVELVNKINIDHEKVGWYIARITPTHVFDNFQVTANSAIIERDIVEGAQYDTLF